VEGHQVLGGGINASYVVTLTGGQKGVFKPISGEFGGGIRQGINGQGAEREVAAWEVAKLVGLEDIVQPTVMRDVRINGKMERGSLQAFVSDAQVAHRYAVRHGDEQAKDGDNARAEAAMLDYVLGNQDRHQGNWMVKKDGDIVLIDHGLILGETRAASPKFNQEFLRDQKYRPVSTPKVWARKYADRKESIRTSLTKLGLPERAIKRAMDRIDKANRVDNWTELYGDGF
jgi:hypothetical protein